MNIKLKAALTVVIGIGILSGIIYGLRSIPQTWIDRYGTAVLLTAVLGFAFFLLYMMALDYYKAEEELKEMEERDKRRLGL